ncbi:MAG: hypothetical protein ACRCTQ_06575 [Brevinemataceae bacterium]
MKTTTIKKNIQSPAHSVAHPSPQYITFRIILRVFVWILIIAFVSTIGVMWDNQFNTFPVILKTSKNSVDISPNSLFMLEKDRLDKEFSQGNANVDRRRYNNFINNITLSNTVRLTLQQNLFNELKIVPSIDTIKQYKQSYPELQTNVLFLEYASQAFNSPLGVLSALVSPSASDLYLYNSLNNLSIATEVLELNKTNFILRQISPKMFETYYKENLVQFLDNVVVTQFVVSNKTIARKLSSFLKQTNVQDMGAIINTDPEYKKAVAISKNIVVTPNDNMFNRFVSIIKAYQEKSASQTYAVTQPIYTSGKYYIYVIDKITEYTNLKPEVKFEIQASYLTKNYSQISKKYQEQWKKAVQEFKNQVNVNDGSFASVMETLPEVSHYVVAPFTLLQQSVSNIMGQALRISLPANAVLLQEILNTSENEVSSIVSPNKAQCSFFVFRVLEKSYSNTVPKFNDPMLSQGVFNFKLEKLNDIFGEKLSNRYYLKIYSDTLTNFASDY